MFEFGDRTEIRTNSPNFFRVLKLMGVIFMVYHCNACLYFYISKQYGFEADKWVFGYQKIKDVRYSCMVNASEAVEGRGHKQCRICFVHLHKSC